MGTDVERPAALGGMIVDFRGIKAETLKDGFVKTGSKLTPEQLVGKQLPLEVVQPKEEQPQQHQQILKEEMSKRVRGN
ncbi:MAG: hypothetical protein H7263_11140 [Candidatus Sericytochromatia bacterium]|nr:hypothetical protein [Candidatus Sericytochromatia bacterium]